MSGNHSFDQQSRSEIIKQHPIGNGLEGFRALYRSVCDSKSIPYTFDALGQLDLEGRIGTTSISHTLLTGMQMSRISPLIFSYGSSKNLFSDLSRLNSAVNSDDFDLDRIKPLLNASLADHLDDTLIWDRVYDAVADSTPPPRSIVSSVKQTPWSRNTSSIAHSSEHRKYVDGLLKEELGPMYVGIPGFHETYFGDVPNLETVSKAFFKRCLEGNNPLFGDGWRDWPVEAKQDNVLSWFASFTKELVTFAESYSSAPAHKRRPLAKPDKPIDGSVGKQKMDIGFVDDPSARKNSRYVREVFAAQGTRRFVLGFTLCGSLIRVWVFDRLGGIASEHFDINKDGLRFVSTILGFLWMSEEQLGFDPTIMTANGQQFIEIKRNDRTERLILAELMRPTRYIAVRATTCWKAH
ncbi:hypothetical protein P885DRAFT_64684 [Corynascus similis CBS 632.67]